MFFEISELSTSFFTKDGEVKAVNKVSLGVEKGQVLGIVGESGSGKSVLGYSLLRLVDYPGRIVGGEVKLAGQSLSAMSEKQFAQQIRGKRIVMVFQDPMMTLNPVLTIRTQMVETVKAHRKCSSKEAVERSIAVLADVGIPAAASRINDYPHHFSGGMRQRVIIAIALLHDPDIIICDEPTTALDVTIQSQIIYQFQQLCRQFNTSLIWISHDLAVVASMADTIATMYAGSVVETGPAQEVIRRPQHPYTAALLRSLPQHSSREQQQLYQIPGHTPSLLDLPSGCAFRTRCPYSDNKCRQQPTLTALDNQRQSACWHRSRVLLGSGSQPEVEKI